jgi:hypothetical protein
MKLQSESQTPAAERRSFWHKLGGGSLSISLLLHLVLVIFGVIWVFQIIPAPVKENNSFTPRVGGSSASTNAVKEKKRRLLTPPSPLSRITVDSPSLVTLSEPDLDSTLTSRTALGATTGLMSGSSGVGRSDGQNKWLGSGTSTHMSDGLSSKNPFGGLEGNSQGLVGSFYDLKQTRTGEPNDVSVEGVVTILNDFVNHSWRESTFNKYFKATQTLYQSKLYIPSMPATGAPAAFNCEDQVQPSRWAVVYRGVITPPRSGKYRLVGYADDMLVVRFNGKNVFDHGFYSGTTPFRVMDHHVAMRSETGSKEIKKTFGRNFPMPLPLKTYHYEAVPEISQSIGGMGMGEYFQAEAGKNYPVEILLSELPGGVFGAVLMIEEEGVKYQKDPGGAPILPLFRFDQTTPTMDRVPFDPSAPCWKVVNEHGKIEF